MKWIITFKPFTVFRGVALTNYYFKVDAPDRVAVEEYLTKQLLIEKYQQIDLEGTIDISNREMFTSIYTPPLIINETADTD